MVQTTTKLYVSSMKWNVNGRKNNNKPVTLFKIVCKSTNFFVLINPKTILIILTNDISVIHIHSKMGILRTGISLIEHTVIKRKSATVSNFEPKILLF